MTRGEERQQAAKDYCHNLIDEATFRQFVAHLAGSQWADQHPVNYDGNAMLYVNNKSHENGYKEAVNKACDWLERALPLRPDDRDEFIEQFEQAMKGD